VRLVATPSPIDHNEVKAQKEKRFLIWPKEDIDQKTVKEEDKLDNNDAVSVKEDELNGEVTIVKEGCLSVTPALDNAGTEASTSEVRVEEESVPQPDLDKGHTNHRQSPTPASSLGTKHSVLESNDSLQLAAHAVRMPRKEGTCIC
jgi:hypothetical protein